MVFTALFQSLWWVSSLALKPWMLWLGGSSRRPAWCTRWVMRSSYGVLRLFRGWRSIHSSGFRRLPFCSSLLGLCLWRRCGRPSSRGTKGFTRFTFILCRVTELSFHHLQRFIIGKSPARYCSECKKVPFFLWFEWFFYLSFVYKFGNLCTEFRHNCFVWWIPCGLQL